MMSRTRRGRRFFGSVRADLFVPYEFVMRLPRSGEQLLRNSEIFSRCDNVLASECRLDTNIANSDTCDFHRITRVASGGKLRHPENIGRFGIGFVSVYQITDYPEIASNGIRLTLFPDQESFNATDAPEIQGTEFRLPWATDGNSQTRRALSASPLTSSDIASLPDTVARILGESLLFLRHVTRAEVRKDGKSVSSYAVTRDDGPGRLKVHVRPADQSSNWCVLQADAGERTSQLCERFGTLADLKRNTGVTVAIPVDQGTEFVGRFFAYLPTEQQHGLSAHINADFFPKPDRKAIVLDGGQHQQAWNAALIECAAATLAENLVALREPLGPVQIWTLIHEAYNNAERATSGSTHPEISAFWKSIKTALERNPAIAMDTSGIWSPASELLHSPTEFETEEVRALRQIGIKLIHPSLADYTDILLIAGVSQLDARSLSAALQEAHVLEELMEGGRVPTQHRRSLLEPLWRAMDKFLARPKSANRSILTSAPLFLTHDHRLTRFDEGRRRPEQVSLERLTKWFPSLPLPHRSLEENAHTLALANELEPERVVSDLKAACRLGDSATLTSAAKPTDLRVFYRLIRDLMVGRDREAGPETLSALAALHIFRAGQGFVAAQSAFLPGDFDDPIGVVSLLVKECYDAVTQEFLRDSLGVDRQSLENYVTTQLPSFFKNAPPIGSYKKLLTVLAKHSSSLLDSSILKDTLLQLRMVPTRDGGWSAPNRTYKHGEELERLLGFAPEWWLDETRTPGGRTTDAFLLDLGVRDGPCAEHLLLAMTELAEKEPTLEAQKRAESLFYVICDNFARWEREAGVDLEWLEMYKSDAIFPADGISDEWFCGESLYGPYRSAAFTSQVRFLPFRNTQRLVPKALKFFGINSEPTTDLVIAHLRHCVAEGTAVSPLAYQILNERANDQAGGALIAQLQNEPCVWSEADRRYVEPNRLFWTRSSPGALRRAGSPAGRRVPQVPERDWRCRATHTKSIHRHRQGDCRRVSRCATTHQRRCRRRSELPSCNRRGSQGRRRRFPRRRFVATRLSVHSERGQSARSRPRSGRQGQRLACGAVRG